MSRHALIKTRKYLALILLCPMLLCCNKKQEEQYVYTLTNTTNESITFDIYTSQQDYNNNTNLYKQLVFAAGEQKTLELQTLKDYYFDWYNADGTITNWIIGNSRVATPGIKYSAPKINDNLTISASFTRDTSRNILLNVHSAGSRWRAAQEYGNGGITVSGAAPYIEVVLNKDFTAVLRQKTALGDTTITNGYFGASSALSGNGTTMRLEFCQDPLFEQQDVFVMNFDSRSFSSPRTTRDTLFATFYSSPYKYYSFVREQ